MFRSIGRMLMERTLVGSGLPRRARASRPGFLAVLAYHNVLPDGEALAGDRSLHLPLTRFKAQLDFLQENFDLVGLHEIANLEPVGRGRPSAAITFDDAYVGAVTLGIPEAASRGIPVTLFVCPGLLGAPAFWWDQLSRPGVGLERRTREWALTELCGRQEEILGGPEQVVNVSASLRPALTSELDSVAEYPGVSLASHSWGHANLARLSPEDIADELSGSRTWLKERYPANTLETHLSFPYGLFSASTLSTAESLGFTHFYRIEGGRVGLPVNPPFILPRLNIPSGISLRGFELRVSGVLA